MVAFSGRSYGADCDRVPKDEDQLKLNGIPWYFSIRQGRYKYIRTLIENEIEELYDIENDPDELTNLALTRKHKKQLVKMRGDLIAELRRTEARIVDRLPNVRGE